MNLADPRPRIRHVTVVLELGAGTGTGTVSGPEPMEIGSMQRKPLTKEEYQRLRTQKGCFYCRQVNAGHIAKNCH